MGSCPACGAQTEIGDRFCSVCGWALASLDPGPSLDPHDGWATADSPDEPVLLLVESATTGAAPARLRSGHPRSSSARWLAAVAGFLAVAVAVWVFGRGGSDPGQDEAAAASVPATDAPHTDAPPTDATDRATVDTTVDSVPDIPTYDTDAGGPVLGRPIGWSLLIGDSYQASLERLDLDTGERLAFEGVTAAPVAVVDGRAVLQGQDDTGTTTLRIVPVDDPAAEGIEIFTSRSSYGPQWPMAPASDGSLWLYADTPAGPTWRLVRMRDGKLLDEVPAPSSFQVYPLLGGGPDVATSSAGGVYRRDGTGYRLISPDRPFTVHQGAVLTRACSAPADCALRWLDVDTGEPVERPLPPTGAVPGIEWVGVVDEAGRFMLGYRRTSSPEGYGLALFDGERGRVIELDIDAFSGGLAASPDGRFLAATGSRGVTLYDADQDRWIAVRRASYSSANLVFVANGEPAR